MELYFQKKKAREYMNSMNQFLEMLKQCEFINDLIIHDTKSKNKIKYEVIYIPGINSILCFIIESLSIKNNV